MEDFLKWCGEHAKWVFSGIGVFIISMFVGWGAVRKHSQVIKGKSSGIQAGRDVTVNAGLAVAEVEKLTKLFLAENFPQLRQDAMDTARDNVAKLLSEFEDQLTQQLADVDTSKFADPDVQYSLNEAVLETAKRGDGANIDLLVTLVLERVAKGSDDLLSLACSDAVKVVPRLTRAQIDFLSVAMFFKQMSIPKFSAITDYEKSAQMAHPLVELSSGMSGWHQQYLESQRCLVHLRIGGSDVYSELKSKYPALKDVSPEQIKKDIKEKTTYFRDFVEVYEKHRMNLLRLTLVGQLVAAINMNRYLPGSSDLRKMIS
jgi:hypothetical protein